MSDNPFGDPRDEDRTMIETRGSAPPRLAGPPPALPHQAAAQRKPDTLPGGADSVPRTGVSPLAAAAAPILEVLGRLATGQITLPPDAAEMRERVLLALRQFETEAKAASANPEETRAAHYVLCAALDDVVQATPWGASSGWASRSLVSTFHQETRSGERVFDLLAAMEREPGRFQGALELTYLALSLGLQGKYRLMPLGATELARTRESLFQLLNQLRGPWERDLSPHWRGMAAPHKGPSRAVPAWVAAACSIALLGAGWWGLATHAGASADALVKRIAALPPEQVPVFDRTRPVAPPPPAAPRADAVPTLAQLLAPEIAEGLVIVSADAQRVTVRIRNRGMFGSGSATVEPRFRDILRRIGEALRQEPGRILVLGHTDNQPIGTVRFPSNLALSDARARAAAGLLAAANGTPARFTAEGRSDFEPIASNATAEGRAENRRIEIVLLRGTP